MAFTRAISASIAGLVKARATCKGDVTGLDIDPSILVPTEKEVLEDLILAAIRDAQSRAASKSADEMRRLTEQLGLPADARGRDWPALNSELRRAGRYHVETY